MARARSGPSAGSGPGPGPAPDPDQASAPDPLMLQGASRSGRQLAGRGRSLRTHPAALRTHPRALRPVRPSPTRTSKRITLLCTWCSRNHRPAKWRSRRCFAPVTASVPVPNLLERLVLTSQNTSTSRPPADQIDFSDLAAPVAPEQDVALLWYHCAVRVSPAAPSFRRSSAVDRSIHQNRPCRHRLLHASSWRPVLRGVGTGPAQPGDPTGPSGHSSFSGSRSMFTSLKVTTCNRWNEACRAIHVPHPSISRSSSTHAGDGRSGRA